MNFPMPTHKGWMLFCPVYARLDEDDPHDLPEVWARYSVLDPLLVFATWCQDVGNFLVVTFVNRDHQPMFKFTLERLP